MYDDNSPQMNVEAAREPSLEELGQSFSEITDKIEELLERREIIRMRFLEKQKMQMDMFYAISAKFDSRIGNDTTVMKAAGPHITEKVSRYGIS